MKGSKRMIIRMCFILILLPFLELSCTHQQQLTPQEYLAWVNNPENGLVQERQIGNFRFSLQYQPCDFLVLKDLLNQNLSVISRHDMDSLKRDYTGMEYFLLRISTADNDGDFLRKSIRSDEDYYDRIHYFTSLVQNDIYLISGSDTVSCLMHHFERSFDLSPFNTLLLAFECKNKQSGKTIIYSDQILGIGKVQFNIPEEKIINIPTIDL